MNLEDIKRYFIFLFGGGLGLLVCMLITFVLTEYAYFDHMLSYTFGLIAALAVNFVYHTRITFNHRNPNAGTVGKFTFIFFLITLVNWILVFLFTKQWLLSEWKYYYLAVIFFVTLFVSVLNFAINKLWVFSQK